MKLTKEGTALTNKADRLSPENLQKLGQVIEDAKGLMSQQLEILDKVLQAEEKIANTRIGHLTKYFDVYSASLDKVADKHSDLDETFIVANREAEKFLSYKGPNNSGGSNNSGGPSNNGGSDAKDITAGKPSGKDRAVFNGDSTELTREDIRGVTKEQYNKAKKARTETEALLDELIEFNQLLHAEERDEAIKTYRAQWKAHEENKDKEDAFDQALHEARVKRWNDFDTQQQTITDSIIALHNLQNESTSESTIEKEDRITAIRLNNQQAVLDAAIATQNYLNNFQAQLDYSTKNPEEAAASRKQEFESTEDLKSAKELEKKLADYRTTLEYKARKKNDGKLSKTALEDIEKQVAKKAKLEKENLKKLSEERFKAEQKAKGIENRKEVSAAVDISGGLSKENNLMSRIKTLNDVGRDENGERSARDGLLVAMTAISDLATQLEKKIDAIAEHKGAIDTRLQGSNNEKFLGSYWDQLVRDMTKVGAVNPYFKQEDFAKNIETLVSKGISFDLKQRAFLMTVSDKIASTFDVSNATLLRLVRIQQEDSTAGRLGMESALNAFLNNMYETSEYLSDVAGSVKGSLEEMESLMKGAEATEVEFQVQKWLGSLYSVGMSQGAVTSIADALGKIAAGDIDGLTNGGAGNLLIMAANDAGLSIADILTDGINSSDTNKLLQAAVNYLAELSASAADNKVVQQQLANVFGVKASDLRAATNLVIPGSTKTISGRNMTYNNMLSQLASMADSMGSRTSIAEMMTNFWENGQYTLAGSMASNPVSYFIYKMAKVVDEAAGGIDLPFLNVMGFGVDLNTTVSDLMRVAAVGSGILGSLGPIVQGLGNSFSGRAMLDKLGIGTGSGLTAVTRGDGNDGSANSKGGGTKSTSGSGYVGNASGSDVKDSTIQESEDSKKQQMIEAKEEAETNQVDILNQTVIKMYELLEEVASGKSSFNVRVEGYGLIKARNSGAQGGVAALGGGSSSFGGGESGRSSSVLSGGGVGGVNAGGSGSGGGSGGSNSTSVSGSVNFSGWTTL